MQAAYMLGLSCSELEHSGQNDKADGAFCDWFAIGCNPDEEIFFGPNCVDDVECGGGSYCAENHCFAGVGSDDMTYALDTLTGTRETYGNFSQLMVEPQSTYLHKLNLIRRATHSLHISTLLIQDDETGYETARILAEAVARGVEVRIIVDATTQYLFSSYQVLEKLAVAGAQIIPYNPISEWSDIRYEIGINSNQRLHEKIFIVDGVQAIVGGRNIGDDYNLPGLWRDTDVYVVGPVVEDTQRLFLELWDRFGDWENQAGCPQQRKYGFYCPGNRVPLEGNADYYPAIGVWGSDTARIISSNPRQQESPHGYISTIAMIRAAKRSIKITNSYFVPPRRLRKHLKAAARRGVEVTVVTNSLLSTDAFYMYYASLNYYKELMQAGIRIFQYRGTETLHSKTMVVDDALVVVGSYNLDPRSATSNSEALMLIRGPGALQESITQFAIDWANTDEALFQNISSAEKAKAKAYRVIEPLL